MNIKQRNTPLFIEAEREYRKMRINFVVWAIQKRLRYDEVGKILGVSKARVQQLIKGSTGKV